LLWKEENMGEQVVIDFDEWLRLGVEAGWCSPPYCDSHDGVPFTVTEEEADEEDVVDSCRHSLRLIPSGEALAPFYARWGAHPLEATVPLSAATAAAVRTWEVGEDG